MDFREQCKSKHRARRMHFREKRGRLEGKRKPWQRTNPTSIPLPICLNTRNLLEFYLGLETGANRWRGGRSKSLHSRRRSFSCHKITHQKHLSIPNEAENFGPSITHTHTHTQTLEEVLTSYIPIQSLSSVPPPGPTLTSYRASRGLTREMWTGPPCSGEAVLIN